MMIRHSPIFYAKYYARDRRPTMLCVSALH